MASSPPLHNDPAPQQNTTTPNESGRLQSKIPGILALAVTAGYFALIALLAFHDMPQRSAELIDILLGALTTGFIMILTFYFGSTAGSQEKTRIMSGMVKKP